VTGVFAPVEEGVVDLWPPADAIRSAMVVSSVMATSRPSSSLSLPLIVNVSKESMPKSGSGLDKSKSAASIPVSCATSVSMSATGLAAAVLPTWPVAVSLGPSTDDLSGSLFTTSTGDRRGLPVAFGVLRPGAGADSAGSEPGLLLAFGSTISIIRRGTPWNYIEVNALHHVPMNVNRKRTLTPSNTPMMTPSSNM